MAHVGLDEVVGQHGVEQGAVHLHIVPAEDRNIEFQVLADLLNLWILQGCFEPGDDGQRLVVVVGKRHIPGLPGLPCKRHPHQFGAIRIHSGGLGVEAEGGMLFERGDQGSDLLRRIGQEVGVGGAGNIFDLGMGISH